MPIMQPRALTPSYDNRHLHALGNMSSDNRLERNDSMNSLNNGSLSSSPNSVRMLTRRPPLPPIYSNYHKRPFSRGHIIANSIPLIRSPSPCSVSSGVSCHVRSLSAGRRSPSVASSRSHSVLGSPTFSTPPRRTYPRESTCSPATEEVLVKEQAPVVFDASLNFVLGCERQRVKQSFRPTASHMEPTTASSYLSSKISQFLKRTDHIMDEWRSLGHKDEAENEPASLPNNRDMPRITIGRSQSATNIMIRGFQYYSRSNSVGKSSSRRSLSRASEDGTLSEGIQEVMQRKKNPEKDGFQIPLLKETLKFQYKSKFSPTNKSPA